MLGNSQIARGEILMAKYIKDKSGKFAGSIPEFPNLESSDSSPIPTLPAVPNSSSVKPPFGSPEWQLAVDEKHRLREQEHAERRLASDMVENFTDKIILEYPKSRYMVYDSNWNPISIEGYDNKVILDLTSDEHASLSDTIKIESRNVLPGLERIKSQEKDYSSPSGYTGISMRIRCNDSPDCEFRRSATGIAPRHKASEYCLSAKRPHCTCDTCF